MSDMKNDRLFSFRLPDADLEALEQIAIDEDRTIADIVRRAIGEYLGTRAGRKELRRTGMRTRGQSTAQRKERDR
jgi:predicted transcriptional regulator